MMSRSETGRRNGNLGVWRKTIRNRFTVHLEKKKKQNNKPTNQTKPNQTKKK